VSDELRLQVTIDDTNIVATSADIEEVDKQMDAVVEEWKIKRQVIINGIRQSLSAISSMMSSFTQAMNLVGAAIDPFFSSLIGMVTSTVSMMLGISAGLASTVVGSSVAVVIASIALYMQGILFAKLVIDKINTTRQMNEIMQAVAGLAPVGQRTIGGI
jgi:hypothetical protein